MGIALGFLRTPLNRKKRDSHNTVVICAISCRSLIQYSFFKSKVVVLAFGEDLVFEVHMLLYDTTGPLHWRQRHGSQYTQMYDP